MNPSPSSPIQPTLTNLDPAFRLVTRGFAFLVLALLVLKPDSHHIQKHQYQVRLFF